MMYPNKNDILDQADVDAINVKLMITKRAVDLTGDGLINSSDLDRAKEKILKFREMLSRILISWT